VSGVSPVAAKFWCHLLTFQRGGTESYGIHEIWAAKSCIRIWQDFVKFWRQGRLSAEKERHPCQTSLEVVESLCGFEADSGTAR